MNVNYKKFILDFTDQEIQAELEDILGHPVILPLKVPKNQWGVITENPEELYQNGKLNEKVLTQAYDNELTEKYFITLAWTSLRKRPKDLLDYIRNIKLPCAVLDFGFGSGTHTIACAQKGCIVYSLDISETMRDYVYARINKREKIGSLIGLEIAPKIGNLVDGIYDFVICADVIEHVPDPVGLIKMLTLKMKIGGVIHLHVSKTINLRKGHLPQAIRSWFSDGVIFMKKNFKQISEHNWQRIK